MAKIYLPLFLGKMNLTVFALVLNFPISSKTFLKKYVSKKYCIKRYLIESLIAKY